MASFTMIILLLISILVILVVLLQRGRGGGLAGAFGGMGGQSAFGTKAGDVFTKITIGLVTAWVLLAGVSGILARKDNNFNNPDEQVVEDDDTGTSIGAAGDEDEDGEESGTEEGPSGEEEGTEEKPEGEEEGTDKDTGSEETTPGEEKPREGSEETDGSTK